MGRVPQIWENKYAPLNTKLVTEGEAGTPRMDEPSPPASPKEPLLPDVLLRRRKPYNQRGRGKMEARELSHLYRKR